MSTIRLTDRALVLASGPEAESLLQNVITPDLAILSPGEARPGALLTPQGKILFDFLIMRTDGDSFRLECRRDIAQDLLKRLTLYKLRAKVDLSVEETDVFVSWDTSSAAQDDSLATIDRRFPDSVPVMRHYGEASGESGDIQEWHKLRITHGVAESGLDYELGDVFPHDVLFDQNGGVGLKKGCFVGQEVVSRMHHRGTARRRLVIIRAESSLPAPGTSLAAGGRSVGTLGSVCGNDGLAIVRIDRAGEAIDADTPVLAGEVPITLHVPAFAGFSLGSAGGDAG
ncbi:CAF17-like 4Fe-4S cluster assembly/insertion protein YgfZ [Chelativorans sp. YIM 93263]|uniref:CAF17-like 4Fe-4S cluster assembly/insertion protein YgfZ n=1 Tax=Chelativorans sp. YIM 93263 TaxID=2906648 RepID=UPI002379AF29|nr:folate-binding protein YgfZ [Chelativorans sp. YIM 93263]